jgi:NMT1/THI5 like
MIAMKVKPLLHLLVLVAGLAGLHLAARPAHAQELFSSRVGNVKVDNVKQADTLEVPFILWGGDVATFYANGGLDTKPNSLFDGQHLKLHLTPGDDFTAQVKNYLSGKTPFLRGTFSMLGQASEVLNADPRTRPVIFLQLTWSAGDHMVSRANCQTLNDLKGKKVALQKFGPHAGMLDDILRTARLTWNDIKVVWTDDVTGDKGPAALFRKDPSVDACFAITPDMAGLTGGLDKTGTGADGTVKDAHVLVSTVQMKRSIADVYACRKDFYDAHKEVVEQFAAVYLKGSEDLVDLKERAAKKEKDAPARYQQILKMTQDIYGKDAIAKEEDADGLISDAVFVGLPGNRSFFTDPGNLSGFDAKQKAALSLAVTLGNAKKPSEFLKADLNYDRLKVLGGLKVVEKKQGPEDVRPTGEAIVNFTISFGPDQKDFDEDKYGPDFQDALAQASLFGNAVMVIRGHADLAKLLQDFVKAGISKGMLRREGNAGNYTYYWNGQKLDLTDTKKVVDLIEKTDFGGVDDDPRLTLKELQRLSEDRAESVKKAVMNHAKLVGVRLDPAQFQAKGVGVLEPVVKQPRNADDMARNRRVEFRLEKRSIESSGGTIDY